MDFYNEVKKVERVKVPSSRPSAFLKDMEVFLMVKPPPPCPQHVLPVASAVWICLSLLRGPRPNWPRWKLWSRSSTP